MSSEARVALTLIGLGAVLFAACSSSSPTPSAAQKNAVAGILGTTSTTAAPVTPVSTSTPPSTSPPASASTTPTTAATGTGSAPSQSAWQAAGTTAQPLYAISCTTPSSCVAVGGSGTQGAAYATGNGGNTWADLLLPAGTPILEGVSCPSASDCVAVGGTSILVTTNAGATWTANAEAGDLRAVSCPDTVHCVAVGAGSATKGVSFSTGNGGTAWAMTPISAATPNAVACPSDLSCFAAGEVAERPQQHQRRRPRDDRPGLDVVDAVHDTRQHLRLQRRLLLVGHQLRGRRPGQPAAGPRNNRRADVDTPGGREFERGPVLE